MPYTAAQKQSCAFAVIFMTFMTGIIFLGSGYNLDFGALLDGNVLLGVSAAFFPMRTQMAMAARELIAIPKPQIEPSKGYVAGVVFIAVFGGLSVVEYMVFR